MHCLDLLLSLGTRVIEGLVLLLNQGDFTFDLLLPLRVVVLLSLLVFLFELTDLLQFTFFLNLKDSLFAGFSEKNIKYWLNFSVELKEIIVTYLGRFVNSSLLRDVLWRWRFRKEFIALCFDVTFFGHFTTLLSQEESQVNLDASWRTRAQIVRLNLRLRLLKFEQLLFDHLNLLFFAFHLDTLLLFLSWSQVLLQKVHIVSVSSEDSLIVHDVKSLTVLFFIVVVLVSVVGGGVLKLLFLADHLRLGPLERLGHIFKLIKLINPSP